jgi:hypothetical protein
LELAEPWTAFHPLPAAKGRFAYVINLSLCRKTWNTWGRKGVGRVDACMFFFPVIALLDIFPIFVGMNTRYWLWGVCNHSYVYFAARSIDDP